MRRAWRVSLGWLKRPWAAVLLAALLGLSVWSLPKGEDEGSAIGEWIGELFRRQRYGMYRSALIEVFVIDEHGRLVLHDPDSESFDAIARGLNEQPERVLRVAVEWDAGRSGVYAVTREWEPRWISVRQMGHLPGLDNSATGRAMFIDWLAGHKDEGWRRFAEEARRGEQRRVRLVWSGYVHNAAALSLLTGLVYSLRWNLSPSVWRARRRQGRLARGECPRCRYAIAGLVERKCPECGEEWKSEPG